MGEHAWLARLRRLVGKALGRTPPAEEDLHSAHTILAPAPPGGMRRVLPPRPSLVAVEAPAAQDVPEPATAPARAGGPERARDNIRILLARGQAAQALPVFAACLKLDPAFQADADSVLPLARQALADGRAPLALRAMQRFDTIYPGHPDTAGVILLSAQCMLALDRPDHARLLVSAFRQHFPRHDLSAQMDALAERLSQRT